MQSSIRLERFVERFEFLRDPRHNEPAAWRVRDRPVFAERMYQQLCWVVTDARKTSETCDENTQ